MKAMLMIVCLVFIFSYSQAQRSVPPYHHADNEYFQRSRANKNTGLILLSVGLLAVGTGAAWIGSSDFSGWDNGPHITTTIGIGFTIASIPVFIISGNQGRRGVEGSIHFSVQRYNNINIKPYQSGAYPSLLMKYSF